MRLIDAEELKHILNNSKYYGTKTGNAFADMITECRTIEARKKGTWLNDKGLYKCSSCGEFWARWWIYKELNYCPYCGAEMREDI